jgi:hypothetical protein
MTEQEEMARCLEWCLEEIATSSKANPKLWLNYEYSRRRRDIRDKYRTLREAE